jgi:glutamate:GABA antiporter
VADNAPLHPPRVMGFADVALLYIVTGMSVRWIATAAAAGPGSVIIWIGACLLFYVPLAMAVLELSSRYPDEGGLYVWTRRAFGDFTGFIVGWCYWTSNLPYFPAVFYFAAGNALYLGGDAWTPLAQSPAYFMGFALIALALVAWLNIIGLKHARWLHNIGAYGMWLPVAAVIVMGAVAWTRYGSATSFTLVTMAPSFQFKDILFWSSLAFAFSGCETASFMSGEIRDARRTIPRALIFAGIVIAACYILGTIALLVAMPADRIDGLAGLMQAVTVMAGTLGWLWIVPVIALLITLGSLGAAGGYLASASRIPFAIGIDRLLPPAFGRLHPRYGTPHIAIMVQTGLGVLFVFLGQAGTSVKGAYDILVSMGIITAFIPFVFVFLALIRLQDEPVDTGVIRVPGGKLAAILFAGTGLTTTLTAIVIAVIPAADEANKALALCKIAGLTALLIGIGAAIYALGRRSAAKAAFGA